MKMQRAYESPQVEELLMNQPLNLLLDMSAELPDGADEGDPDTFGEITITTP